MILSLHVIFLKSIFHIPYYGLHTHKFGLRINKVFLLDKIIEIKAMVKLGNSMNIPQIESVLAKHFRDCVGSFLEEENSYMPLFSENDDIFQKPSIEFLKMRNFGKLKKVSLRRYLRIKNNNLR